MSDFDFEPIPGLPAKLPAGETVLWQGSPDWRMLARQLFKVRLLLIYFGVLIAWKLISSMYDGQSAGEMLMGVGWVSVLAGICIGILCLLAWGTARTTIYTITNKRVIMRYGMALTLAMNIPFRIIESAALKLYGSGHGDLPLTLLPGEKIAYLMLWPHARPWHMKQPQPMLRCIPDARAVSDILGRALALAASAPSDRESASEAPSPNVQPLRPAQSSDSRASQTADTPDLAGARLARTA